MKRIPQTVADQCYFIYKVSGALYTCRLTFWTGRRIGGELSLFLKIFGQFCCSLKAGEYNMHAHIVAYKMSVGKLIIIVQNVEPCFQWKCSFTFGQTQALSLSSFSSLYLFLSVSLLFSSLLSPSLPLSLFLILSFFIFSSFWWFSTIYYNTCLIADCCLLFDAQRHCAQKRIAC